MAPKSQSKSATKSKSKSITKSKSKSASKSKSSSKSNSASASAAAVAPFFKAGSAVEISSEDDGFRGSWFTGTIIRRQGADKFLVEYDNLLEDEKSSKRLREVMQLHHIRPVPPTDTQSEFKYGDEVDAFHNDGWWEGHITEELADGKFAVYFRVSREQIAFSKEELRPHREWINDNWVPPFQQEEQQHQNNELEKVVSPHVKVVETVVEENGGCEFKAGTLVEVSSDEEGFRGAWFSAVIIEAKGKKRFVVEYESLLDDDSKLLREEVDILYIRPRPPQTDAFAEFKFLDEVDASSNDGWWAGVVSKVLGDSKYIVYFRNSNEELEFQHSQLRLHLDWIDGKWVGASKALKF